MGPIGGAPALEEIRCEFCSQMSPVHLRSGQERRRRIVEVVRHDDDKYEVIDHGPRGERTLHASAVETIARLSRLGVPDEEAVIVLSLKTKSLAESRTRFVLSK